MFEIDKNIPVTPRASYISGSFAQKLRDTFAKMEVGDSFVYEDTTPSKSANRTIRAVARQEGFKVTVRQVEGSKFRAWKLS